VRLVKLTDSNGYTRRGLDGETLWLPVGTRPPRLNGSQLCAEGVYHAYSSPEQAVLMDPIHARLLPLGRAWWAEGEVVADDGTKVGCHTLVLVEPCELPTLTTAQRVRAAIYCAQDVLRPGAIPAWEGWAADWLAQCRWVAAEALAAEALAAREAALAAREAAEEAAEEAEEAAEALAARAAAWAAEEAAEAEALAAREAAWAAAWAAAAARSTETIDLTEIVQRAMGDER
jgi:hypothetical protein